MSLLLDIKPADLGLPPKFTCFRDVQADALSYALASEKRWIGANAPTGIGKSLLGVAYAKSSGDRGVYLTSTKSLQDQIQSDFSVIGMRDMRGRSNYHCVESTRPVRDLIVKPAIGGAYGRSQNRTCEEGNKELCHHRQTTYCPRFAAYERAKEADLISTNYACWMHTRRSAPNGFEIQGKEKPVTLLICDEAHHAFDEIAGFMAVSLSRSELPQTSLTTRTNGLMSDSSMWQDWARSRAKEVDAEIASLVTAHGSIAEARYHDPAHYGYLEDLSTKLGRIESMDSNWVWENEGVVDGGVRFECIWPAQYASVLWSRVETILLLSATLYPYTMRLLGLSKEESDWKEFSNGWPPNRGPVYYLPVRKLSMASSDADYREVVRVIDDIISTRMDRKGIIQTVSYARMHKLLEFSRHRKLMYFNTTASGAIKAAERFRAAKPPAVLISPSFSTGWDFAYSECEYQIIPKTPYPYAESRVMEERLKDPRYRYYVAMLDLQQMIGRGRRGPDDRCETFILDKSFPLLMAKAKAFAPKTFKAYPIAAIPKRPEKLSV